MMFVFGKFLPVYPADQVSMFHLYFSAFSGFSTLHIRSILYVVSTVFRTIVTSCEGVVSTATPSIKQSAATKKALAAC